MLHLLNDLQFGGATEYLVDLGSCLDRFDFDLHIAFGGADRVSDPWRDRWTVRRSTSFGTKSASAMTPRDMIENTAMSRDLTAIPAF